jgi:hypothetical protein
MQGTTKKRKTQKNIQKEEEQFFNMVNGICIDWPKGRNSRGRQMENKSKSVVLNY